MTKEQIINELSKHEILGEGRVIVKEIDYSNNRLAPELVAYRIHYTDLLPKHRWFSVELIKK